MKKIIKQGIDTYRATCSECGTVFTYQREDVHTNFVRNSEEVGCPHCGHAHLHLGASTGWLNSRETPYCLQGKHS